MKRLTAACLAGAAALWVAACAAKAPISNNLVANETDEKRAVNLFGPMEKSNPDASENTLRSAFDMTVMKAEEKLNLTVEYKTYTAEDYTERTYDEVVLDRVRSGMDDMYLLNPDTIRILGEEGLLLDLSDLECVDNLRDVVKIANTIDGKLVAIPQEVVAYGLFVNKDMFDEYNLELPHTPEDLMECCRVFKENGVETPIGANRWWLECFVFAQAYAEMYNGGDTEAEVEALNEGKAKYSDYMRPGFEYLAEMINRGYIDAQAAYTYEAIEGEGPDFLAGKTPIVMAYWAAANTKTSYGDTDFELQVIGFPSSLGQMPVMALSGYGVSVTAEHMEDTLKTLEIILSDEALQVYTEINRVISPSKNIEVECVPALKPLNDRIKEDSYVLVTNAGMKMEQWGNVCLLVRDLLGGATVDECMERLDRLQEETLER